MFCYYLYVTELVLVDQTVNHHLFPGYRHWHADLRSTDTPLEAGLAFTCKLKTPIPFKGREAIEKQKQEGIRKKLICLTTEK